MKVLGKCPKKLSKLTKFTKLGTSTFLGQLFTLIPKIQLSTFESDGKVPKSQISHYGDRQKVVIYNFLSRPHGKFKSLLSSVTFHADSNELIGDSWKWWEVPQKSKSFQEIPKSHSCQSFHVSALSPIDSPYPIYYRDMSMSTSNS